MINFLEETTAILEQHNKSWSDVCFIRTEEVQVKDIEKFKKSMDFEYDNGFGSEKIPMDLILVGNNWWIERHEYDGSEWWEYKSLPSKLSKVEDVFLMPTGFDSYELVKEVK